jgi:hypothetical protein
MMMHMNTRKVDVAVMAAGMVDSKKMKEHAERLVFGTQVNILVMIMIMVMSKFGHHKHNLLENSLYT